MSKLTTPSVLAFEGKLIPSDAVMFQGNWQQESFSPILVTEKSVRGTISNRLKAKDANDPAKLDAEVSKANLQKVDISSLDHDKDTLKLSFSLRVISGVSVPSTCNSPEYQAVLAEKVEEYVQKFSFTTLAERYAYNLASGRFLWRNRVGAEQVKTVIISGENRFEFDAQVLSLRHFESNDKVSELAQIIESGLVQGHELLEVEAYVQLGKGQTVFPSQELVMGTSKGDKSKFLYQLNGQAAIHSQKVGNALRTIDTWFSGAETVGPIAVEPYGSVTNRGIAYRQPKQSQDFYSLLDSWVLKDKTLEEVQQHYVVAMLIRGGVFGG